MLVKFRQGLYGNPTHRQPRFGVECLRVPKCSVFAPAHTAQLLIKSEQGVIQRQATPDAAQFVVKAQGKLIQRRIAAKLPQVRQADTPGSASRFTAVLSASGDHASSRATFSP